MGTIKVPAGLPERIRTVLQPSIESTKLVLTEAPFPVPTHPDDVLLRVHATAPCNGELLWAKNYPSIVPSDKLPVPCQDIAASVVAAPADSGFATGDHVFCRIDAARPGGAREYTLARVRELAHKPASLSWVDAAAVPLSSLTAWQALFVQGTLSAAALAGDDLARKQNGEKRVLITGAGGGVGSMAVQLAALSGAGAVVALCGADNAARVRELGATEVIDYRTTKIASWAAGDASRQVDLVLDMVGGETLAGCWAAVKDGGVLISVNSPPDQVKPANLDKELLKSAFFVVDPLGKNLAEIARLVEQGKLTPIVDSVWTMEEFDQAFAKLESGHAKGKIIIKISPEA